MKNAIKQAILDKDVELFNDLTTKKQKLSNVILTGKFENFNFFDVDMTQVLFFNAEIINCKFIRCKLNNCQVIKSKIINSSIKHTKICNCQLNEIEVFKHSILDRLYIEFTDVFDFSLNGIHSVDLSVVNSKINHGRITTTSFFNAYVKQSWASFLKIFDCDIKSNIHFLDSSISEVETKEVTITNPKLMVENIVTNNIQYSITKY